MIEHRYDAFISYNHAADGDLAPAIERGLERLAKPWYRLRAISVFRDVSDTGLNPSLWGTVQRQLDGSRWFVLLACPESAASQWVRREIDHWCDTKGPDTVLLVLTGGELRWDRLDGRFADDTTALAPEVAARFASEPLHLDLRWTAELGRPPALADARFKTEMARLASPIRDLPPDEIESEDVRLHRKARRLARGAVAALVTLAIVATIAAVIAVRNANEAERRARQAVARQLGLAALDMPANDLDEALLVSLAASRLDPDAGPERFLASRTLLGRHSRLVALLHTPTELGEPSLRGVAITPAGDVVAATAWPADGQPQVVRWDLPDGGDPVLEPLASTAGASVGFDADGAIVTPWNGSTVALHPDGHLAVVADGTIVQLVDTGAEPSAPLAQWPAATAVAAVADDRAAVVADGVLHLVDTHQGVELASAPVGLGEPVGAIGVRGDDVLVATGSELTWWSLDRGDLVPTAGPITVTDVGEIVQIAPAAAGRRALVAGRRGTAVVDDDGVLAIDDATGSVVPDPTRRFVAVVGTQLSIWSFARAQRVLSVPEPVNAAAWSSCDVAVACRLVTAGATVDVWEPAADRRIRLADQTNAQAVDITADGGTVVTAGWGPSVAVWSLTLPIDDRGREQIADAGGVTAYDATTGTVATADGTVVVVAAGGSDSTTIETGPVEQLALTSGANSLVVDGGDALRVVDVASGSELELDPRCLAGIWAVSPSGRWLATHDPDSRQTALCELEASAPPTGADAERDDSDSDGAPSQVPAVAVGFAIGEQATEIESIAVDDDGAIALGGGGLVEYRPLVDGAFVRRAEAVSTGYADELVTIPRLAVRDGRVAAAVETPDGELARVLVWDARRRGTPIQFETDHSDLGAIALLGDSAELLAVAGRLGDGDTVVQVWETESRRQLGRGLGGLGRDVRALAGDATAVIGTDADGRTFRWPLDVDPRREVCAIVARDLTADEWETAAGGMLGRYDQDPLCDDAS